MVLLVPSDTAPFRARARPIRFALSTSVMLVRARMFPFHCEAVPMVAELPTCQYTFFACAPLMRMMLPAVVSPVPAWKTKVAFGSPPPSRIRLPVKPIDVAEEKTPAGLVVQPRFATLMLSGGQGRPASVLYAFVRSICA